MDNIFTTGQLVEIKSGGPVMTVIVLVEGRGGYKCQWFDGKKLEYGFFPAHSLRHVEQNIDSLRA